MLLHEYGSNKVAAVTFDIPKLKMVAVLAKPIDSGIQSLSNFARSEHWTRR